ncbi:MAG TPA: DUF2946 family protein, partial [Burkholderiales bacterium]|nr:DUF2946 family protein [Burkholderiales bacterium]
MQRTRAALVPHMDDSVLRALTKWPDVPAAYGWLALDRRGNWSIKGERIGNPALVDFIGRNYAHDERGRWFFQNGPQRAFVRLEYAPYVLRTQPAAHRLALRTHNGMPARPRAAWLDDAGSLLVEFGDSVGLVHDQDLAEVLSCLRDARGAALPDDAVEALLQSRSAELFQPPAAVLFLDVVAVVADHRGRRHQAPVHLGGHLGVLPDAAVGELDLEGLGGSLVADRADAARIDLLAVHRNRNT